MAVVTRRYENDRLNFDVDILRWRAHIEFDVVGAVSRPDAIAQVAGQMNIGFNSPHPECSTLRCLDVNADGSLFTVYRVNAEFGVPPGGEAPASADPLSQPPMIRWDPALQSVDFSYTQGGTPVQTAAGQPFDPPAQTDMPVMTLSYTRFQPFYDAAQATRLMGTMNSDNFVIPGKVMQTAVLPGQARIKHVVPVEDYSVIADWVKVQWVFEIRPTWRGTDDNGVSDAWDVCEVNRGTMGWYNGKDASGNQKAMMDYFWTAGATPTKVTDPVYLDTAGKPLDTSSFKVGQDLNDAVANPTPMQEGNDFVFEPIEAPEVPGGVIYIMHFKRLRPIPYSSLL